MQRSTLATLALAHGLAGCAVSWPLPPAPPSPPLVAHAGAIPVPVRGYDLRVAALPIRSAGAAFAAPGEEHALILQRVPRPVRAQPVVPEAVVAGSVQPGASAPPPPPARVLEVHSAYRRRCVGMELPGDRELLASAGGLRLPGGPACDPPPTGSPRSAPTALFPAAVRPRPRRQSVASHVKGAASLLAKHFNITRSDCGRDSSSLTKTPGSSYIVAVRPEKMYRYEFAGFSAFWRLGTLFAVIVGSAGGPLAAAEPSLSGRFFGRGADGWFWYETLPPPPPPPALEPDPEAPPPPAAVVPVVPPPAGPPPLSAAWFRAELERYRDTAIDDPSPENVRAYLYLQKVMLDKADAFAQVSRQAVAGDPYLDAVTERPLSPFAANAISAEATARRAAVLQELAARTGILFFVDGACGVCVRQADVLLAAQRQFGFALLTVSRDGRAPAGLELPLRADGGQAAQLGVVATPALFLMRPPDAILPLAQGALDLDTLSERIVGQAHQAGWVDEATFAATRAVRQPFALPAAADLEAGALEDPALLVASLRERLGLAEAALAELGPAAPLPAELLPTDPVPPTLAAGGLP